MIILTILTILLALGLIWVFCIPSNTRLEIRDCLWNWCLAIRLLFMAYWRYVLLSALLTGCAVWLSSIMDDQYKARHAQPPPAQVQPTPAPETVKYVAANARSFIVAVVCEDSKGRYLDMCLQRAVTGDDALGMSFVKMQNQHPGSKNILWMVSQFQ